MHRARLIMGPIIVACVMAGCPRSFDPAAAPNLTSANPAANSSFSGARRLFDAGSLARADAAFAAYLKTHPTDNLVPQARVFRGRIALGQQKPRRACEILASPAQRPADDETGLQARYYLGLASVRVGAHAQGRKLLRPFLKIVKAEKLPPLLISLAHACVQLKDHVAAIPHLSRLHGLTDRPTEKAYARGILVRLVDTVLTDAQVRAAHGAASSDSLLVALTARKLARLARAAGKAEEATRLLRETAAARTRHGVELAGQGKGVTRIHGNLIGLLVPLRGRYRLAGKQLLAGAMEGARSFEPGEQRKITLVIRDSSKDPAEVARKLLQVGGVVALAGTLDPVNSRAVAAVAALHDAPFVSLAGSRAGNKKNRSTLRIFPTNTARAQALARQAVKKLGLRRVVILAPGTPYGELMARAFGRAVKSLGGVVALRLTYPRRATTFADQARRLKNVSFDALFVPDTARALALIAPALAKVGLWSAAPGATAARGTRTYQMLATGEGVSRSRLAAAARYLEAAVLAPGYFAQPPAAGDPPSAVSRFSSTHGRPPTLVEAFAFDATHVLRSHLTPDIKERAPLLSKLRGGDPGHPAGLTGKIRFGADGQRVDPPMMFQVKGGKLKGL